MQRSVLRRAFALLTLLLVPMLLAAQGGNGNLNYSEIIKPNPDIKMGTLSNGMKYYIMRNGKPEKRVEMILAVNAGAVLEDNDQNGLAHFCEHMAFNGTQLFPKQELVKFLESTGIRFGADLNAYTNQDETVYMLTIPSEDSKTVIKGIQVLRDWAGFVTYDNKDIEEERGVIMEEWRLGKGADDRVSEKHSKKLYYGSKYAERNVIGDTNVLKHCPPDNLRRFYRTWYRPENMAIVIVGDADPNSMLEFVTKYLDFRPSEAGNNVPAVKRPSMPLPPHKETLISVASDPELDAASLQVINKHAIREAVTLGNFRTNIIDQLAAAMVNARLAELARKAQPPFAGAGVGDGALTRETGAFFASARAADKNVLKSLNALMTELERAKRHGFTQTELDRAKQATLARMEKYYNERNKTESQGLAMELVRNFLTREAAPGIVREYEIYKQLMPTISVQDVASAFAANITPENRVITISVPQGNGYTVPTESDVKSVLDAVAGKTIDAYVDAVPVKPLMSRIPAAGSIKSSTNVPEIGAKKLVLSNGATVFLKKTDFKDDQILFSARAWGGTSLASDADFLSASQAAQIVDAGGIADVDATTLEKMLNGKTISLSPFIDDETQGFVGSTTPKDARTFFELLNLYFTQPRKDAEAFSSVMTKMKTALVNQEKSPERALFDTVTVALTGNHFRKRPLKVADLDRINLDRAFEFYKERFSNAAGFTFYFVGNFNPDSMESYLKTYVASLPAKPTKETWKDLKIRTPDGRISKTVYKGIEDKSFVALTFHGPMKYNQIQRYDLAALCEVMTIRLREQMREEKSGVYFVSVQPQPTKTPIEEYAIAVIFSCAPDRVDEMIKIVENEAENLRKNAVDNDYIHKVKEIQTKEREVAMKRNEFWLRSMSQLDADGEPWSVIADRDVAIKGLTAEQVRKAAQDYLVPGNFCRFVLKPEKK